MIEEGLWAEGTAPAGHIDLVGDADSGDVQWFAPCSRLLLLNYSTIKEICARFVDILILL
jgi:hypothetical protein